MPLPSQDFAGLVIRILEANNPRQKHTQGWHNWHLYRDGMSYDEYIALPWDATLETFPTNGRPPAYFKGPRADHVRWDVAHGYIEFVDPKRIRRAA